MTQKIKQASLLFPMLLVCYEVITYLSNDMYLPGLPALMQDFNISQDLAQYTLTLWFLGSASMQLIVGPLSDRFGRKLILLSGGVLFILSSFLCAITTDINWMLLGRLIQGCTVCSVVVAGYAAIHESYDTKAAIRITTLMGMVTILAPALGPLLGAIVLEILNWRAIFYFLGITSLIAVGCLFKTMVETNKKQTKLHLLDILKDYFIISKRRAFLGYTLPFCFLFLSLICWIVESPFLIIETYHKTPLDYGLIQFLVFGSFMVGAQATRILIHNNEVPKIINYGLKIAAISGVILILCIFLDRVDLYYIVGTMMLMAFGSSMAFGPLNRSAIDTCTEPMGRRMAIFSSFMSFFGVLATILVTAFNDKTIQNLSLMIAFGTILAFLIFTFMRPKHD